ncbi:DUF6876 family protein [Ferribacterium limneticum]|uniref:DUF6876 family protein n=1 Tax=Ferribacterium limneticum TaxID=76259 RepID=UPI001CF92177|nr:DUF6876 family protein [Ferribacterium limneticum]UCV26735.1 hypothetical protein KI617_10480 [Ferribacterium limneticum]UCV30652.1 hypothetical protein KI608_10480 [Ferribacterium limneticum]
MKSAAEIQAGLPNFYGTELWHRYSPVLFPNVLLTDGAKYIAEECGAYWLMDAIASYRGQVTDGFAVVKLVKKGNAAVLTLANDDPADVLFARQEISYTDFPLDEIKLYLVFDGQDWTLMLTGEY